jgi:16S rRNA (guanine966-N2)-methyltransferase
VGAVALDAFCGTGALGLEAVSQGAASCTFLDAAKVSLSLAAENAKTLGVSAAQTNFLLKDSTHPGPCPESVRPANLVFLDPPYGKNFVPEALSALAQGGWIEPGAFLVLETEREANLSSCPVEVLSEKIYGKTKTTLGCWTGEKG